MNRSILFGVSALLAGGALGFVVGKSAGGSDQAADQGQAGVNSTKVIHDRSSSGRSSGSSSSFSDRSVTDVLRDPGQTARIKNLIDLYASMDAFQLAAEAEKLDGLPMADRFMASMLLYARWGEVDPMGALEHTKSLGFASMFVKPTIMRSWASVDPVNAAAFYDENPNQFSTFGGRRGPMGEGGASVIAREWAKSDPTAALAWAQSLDGNESSDAVVTVISQMAMSDPEQAAKEAAKLDEQYAARAYGEIAEQWAKTDMAATEAWINTLSGEAKERAMASALGSLASQDPVEAASRVSSISDEDSRDRAIRDVASTWSREDPKAAATWLVEQDADDGAMWRVMGNWVSQDSAGALTFIQEQPVGEMRDTATQTYLRMNRNGDPAEAVSLAEGISDEGDRSRTLSRTVSQWMREDEAAATSYVQSTDMLSDNAKERLLSGEDDGDRRRR